MTTLVVPGATLRRSNDFPFPVVTDDRGRPVWDMPRPVRQVPHYVSAGMRRKVNAGEASLSDAVRMVPVYRAVDKLTAKTVARGVMRARREAMKRREEASVRDATPREVDRREVFEGVDG